MREEGRVFYGFYFGKERRCGEGSRVRTPFLGGFESRFGGL